MLLGSELQRVDGHVLSKGASAMLIVLQLLHALPLNAPMHMVRKRLCNGCSFNCFQEDLG
jgi:hypothetical protein